MDNWNTDIYYSSYVMSTSTAVSLTLFIVFLSYLISFVVCGAVCKRINEKKGYNGGWAWGLLGIVGIIICACRNESLELRTNHLQSVLIYVLQNYAQTTVEESNVKSSGLSDGLASNVELQAENNPTIENKAMRLESLIDESLDDSYTCPFCGKVQKKNPFGCIYCHGKI